ncbi:HupE/UreJ family protein [Solirubrobacter phytolaccae]|uniref:HupE/UreJ family protein n=1 Tax=Solirubrobacter phytolaccae TaxID=1404360 RepID=A0A9X3SE84_9ACTN|nr:HupE/UreJ family protein [Solirubrobacter phytolaccae]MDA0184640.1 HupE/UreJ family protein [Solirubrobacter phytolaccae]
MRTAVFALLLALLLPATAAAEVDKPGTSEVRQDGTRISWTLGIPGEELTSLAGGETKEQIAGYMANNVRMSVDAESCPGGMHEATPIRRDGVEPFARVEMRFSCPKEAGKFELVNETFVTNVTDYELGGASGTFRFDADHTLLESTSPKFPRWVRDGFESIIGGWEHVLFLAILLLGARGVREFGTLAATAVGATLVALVLAVEGIVNVPERTLELVTVASIVGVAALPVLGIRGRPQVYAVFVLALAHGLAVAVDVPTTDALLGFGLGVVAAEALVVSLAGALPLAWRALGRKPGAPAPGRERSAAR